METFSRNTCFVKTQNRVLCLDDFDLRCESLRLVVMTVPFYYVNIFVGRRLSRLGPKWAYRRDNSAPSSFLPASFHDQCRSKGNISGGARERRSCEPLGGSGGKLHQKNFEI